MPEVEIIVDALKTIGIQPVGQIISDETLKGKIFFVPIAIKKDSGLQEPSNKKLKEIAKSLATTNKIAIEYLLHDNQSADVESGLRATLLHQFGDLLRNAFLSVNSNGKAIVWVEKKKSINSEEEKQISEKAKVFLQGVGITEFSTHGTSGENLPGTLVLLRSIKKAAPVQLDQLAKNLQGIGFVIPSGDWLKRKLDLLRRKGRLVRTAQGEFVLSLETLRILGTSKDRNSSDIARMLALSRRTK